MAETSIVPHAKAKGVDFLGCSYTHVVRSDLGCYAVLSSNNLHQTKLTIYPLHPNCSWGDHYMAYKHKPEMKIGDSLEYYYIIKGNEFRRVNQLYDDRNAVTGILHPTLQRGDFYLGTGKNHKFDVSPIFIVIFEKKKIFRVASDLTTAAATEYLQYKGCKEFSLHENCQGGLYYWSTKSYLFGDVWYYILKGIDKWGVKVHYTKDLSTDEGGYDDHIDRSLVNFLPGGMAANMGPTTGYWQKIKSINNSTSNVPLNFSRTIKKKNGYKKGILHSVQHNWSMSANCSQETQAGLTLEGIFSLSCKEQFSLSMTYGGNMVDTTHENWSEESTEEEHMEFTVPPKTCVHIWQYILGHQKNGKYQDILYSKHLMSTNVNIPPTMNPFYQSKEMKK